MEEQLLGKKRGGDIPPAEETPASSSYVKDKEGRKNESTAHAEPQPANPADGATEQAQSTFAAAATVDASALAVNGQHAVAGVLSVGGNPVAEAGPDVSLKKAAERLRKKKQKATKQKLKLEEKLKLAMQMRQQQEAVEKLEEAQQVAKQKLEAQVKRKRSKEQKRKQDIKQRKRRKRQEPETMPATEVEVQPPTEQVQVHQDAGTWTRDMDFHLSNFVRKYGFDFAKSSNALRAYVQHILVDMDDMEIDSQTITEESCRTRWSLLDRTALERGQNIARELVTARGAREELIGGPSATLGGLEAPSVATGADGTREGPVRRQITSTKDSVAATEAGSEGRGKQTASGVHRPKSVATPGRDSKQRQRMKARQEASKKRKHRKSSKLKLQGMAHVNPADKRGKGTARATRKQKRVANDTRRAHAIALDRATETGVTGGQRLCKFFLNEGDAKRLRALSLSVPTGKHILASCSKKNNCTHLHSDEASTLRCERLICKYKRKDSRASAEAQQKARARCEQRGKLMHFDWKKGFGFITPDNRQPGSDIRRQGIFFHIRDWKCSSTFPDKQAQLPLPVRFNRQPSNRAQGGRWRAVQVSRLGGAKAHLLHGSPA